METPPVIPLTKQSYTIMPVPYAIEEFAEDTKKCQCQIMSTGTLSIFLCPVAQPTTLGSFVTTFTAKGRKMEKMKTKKYSGYVAAQSKNKTESYLCDPINT